MAELYTLHPGGFSFEDVHGYNKLPPNMINRYFRHLRCSGTDFYLIKRFTPKESLELDRGPVSTLTEDTGDYTGIEKKMDSLLESEAKQALLLITSSSQVHCIQTEGFSLTYIACSGGCMGSAWYDHIQTTAKGQMLSAFLLYAYGLINADKDPLLWEAAYCYLPYQSELEMYEDLDPVFLSALKEEILGGQIIPPTDPHQT